MQSISAKKTAAAANIAKLPELCYTKVATEDVVCIIKRGESGYYRTDWKLHDTEEAADRQIAKMNAGLKVTPNQQLALEIGSMAGWHVPGADVDRLADLDAKKRAAK